MYYFATFIFSLCLLSASFADARVFTFTDSATVWPGYEGSSKSDVDIVGNPEITGGSLSTGENGLLENITINYEIGNAEQSYLDLWNQIKPEDLFLDVGSDGTWDVVVTDEVPNSPDTAIWNVYEISTEVKPDTPGSVYDLGSDRFPGTSDEIRGDHPVALKAAEYGDQIGTALFSPTWICDPGLVDRESIAWTFSFFDDDGIFITQSTTLGWVENCANDVLYEQIMVPAPAALLLLVSGACILGLLRKEGVVA
jgi:hypothetical protein